MRKIFIVLILLTGILHVSSYAQESLKLQRSPKIEKIEGKDYYIHTVKKGQTLYMIGKTYDVDVDVLIRENPIVTEGLKTGQKIRIPVPATAESPKKQPKSIPEEKKQAIVSPEEIIPFGKDKSSMKKSYTVALMIPLYLDDVMQMDVIPDPGASPQENRPLQFIQFYEGFRMALDSLGKTGVTLKVNVYDAERDTLKTLKLLQDPQFKNTDLIIGMMYHRNFQMVSDFAEKNKIPIVNPLSERDLILEKHKHVFKVRPSLKTQFSEMIRYIQTNFKDSNIVVVSDSKRINKITADSIMRAMEYTKADVHLADGYREVISLLTNKKPNLIIMISDDKSYVLDVVTKLNEHRTEFGITMLGIPRWDHLDDIETDYLVNLKTLVMAPYFVDYDDAGVKKFVSMYEEKYHTDPEPLAFQGFDITFYFISALWKFGTSFDHCIPDFRMNSLQTDFRFSSSKDNGYENQYWEMYQYENYHLRRIILNP